MQLELGVSEVCYPRNLQSNYRDLTTICLNLLAKFKITTQLISQTFLGAANMVKATAEEPSMLRKHVTSPNGTTQAAIEIFEQHNIKQWLIKGIESAIKRSEQLGNGIKSDVNS